MTAETTEPPLVSIITLSLNSSAVIEATMKSVFSQQYPRIEYIVIDGGSQDNTKDIIAKHEEKIAYWVSEPDNGISDAFNKGIRVSKGDIIGILNSGDIYADGAVSLAAKTLVDNPDYDFVYGDIIYNDSDGKPQFLMKGDPEYLKKIRYTMPALNHPTIFIRGEVYKTCGLFDISYRIAMDYEFFLRISVKGKRGLYIEKPLAMMVLGGISYRSFRQGYKEVCKAAIRYGHSPLNARLRYHGKVARGTVRVILEMFGLNALIRLLRKLFWNVR